MTEEQELAAAFNQLNERGEALIVGTYDSEDSNHKVAFVSEQFIEIFGYTTRDIPDKETWWRLAYPDRNYRKVVERQWELLADQHNRSRNIPLEMEINITAKNQTVIRSTVCAEPPNKTVPGHYIITFRTS